MEEERRFCVSVSKPVPLLPRGPLMGEPPAPQRVQSLLSQRGCRRAFLSRPASQTFCSLSLFLAQSVSFHKCRLSPTPEA